MGKPLQQTKFNQINRSIKDMKRAGVYGSAAVAKDHGVSVTTVNFVRNAKTWKSYQAFLSTKAKAKVSKPVETMDGFPQPEKQFAKSLEQLELNPIEYVTKKQFTDAIDSLSAKTRIAQGDADVALRQLDIQKQRSDTHMRRLDGHSKILSRIQRLKPRWFREG